RGPGGSQRGPGAEDQPPAAPDGAAPAETSEAPAREANKYDERIVAVTMPKWGLSMRLGKITGWIVAEGDDVSVGDDLADIETDKIAGTLEAADPGTFRPLLPR